MRSGKREAIHVMEFGCQAPLKFYEHCVACPKFGDQCSDLGLGKEILRGKKRLVHNEEGKGQDGEVYAGQFKCSAPLSYFEATRMACAHKGRCREEGLLLSLLAGKNALTYAQRSATTLLHPKAHVREKEVELMRAKAGAAPVRPH